MFVELRSYKEMFSNEICINKYKKTCGDTEIQLSKM